ncbi:hypothetical protein QBC41DRAFT_384575 [Cercophora samala]|uniref:Microbial-type PARG catalytic domain-containing protein n=1 Tax=Cercophora samala TaxID=330535 RepID=A0AA39YVM1_9PEZI|nr:hypothetical protein QBC41DRAFT_384575 [Cercophora samala]
MAGGWLGQVWRSLSGSRAPRDRSEPDGWDHRLNPGEARRRYHVNPRVPQRVDYNPPGRWQRQNRVGGGPRPEPPPSTDIHTLPIGPRPPPPARPDGPPGRTPLPSGRPPPLRERPSASGTRRSPPGVRRSPPGVGHRYTRSVPVPRPPNHYHPAPPIAYWGLPPARDPIVVRRVTFDLLPQVDTSVNPVLRAHLTALGADTRRVLPDLLNRLGRTAQAETCERIDFHSTRRLDPTVRPARNPQVTIRVVNMDSLDAAMSLPDRPPPPMTADGQQVRFRPLILNFSDVARPGNGWKHGDLSQSEALCYRTSLAMSLERGQYPLSYTAALYSPYVQVVRENMESFLDLDRPHLLPVVAAVTISAQLQPETDTFMVPAGNEPGRVRPKTVFHWDVDRERLKLRMRLVLRVAGTYRHTRLILGAIGCGSRYKNPAEDVALCWLEVLREDEFAVDWWTDVVFAVHAPPSAAPNSAAKFNYEVFKRVLDGKHVGEYYWRLHE